MPSFAIASGSQDLGHHTEIGEVEEGCTFNVGTLSSADNLEAADGRRILDAVSAGVDR